MEKSTPSPQEQCSRIEAAIAAQEAQRGTLGDAVVDVTIRTLRERLENIRSQAQGSAWAPEDVAEELTGHLRHLPKDLADKMMATGDIKGDRRQATVLFADIAGFTEASESLDPEEVADFIQKALKEFADTVYRFEGYVDKFLGDAVMAVFGAPVAHEDDADRALRAALSMMDQFAVHNRRWREKIGREFGLHIGINTGTVVAGNVDADLRMPYSVLGDTVNTAARLEEASEPGQILVSQSTYRQTREAFSFQVMEPMRVKGKREPVVVYKLLRARLAPRKTRGLTGLASAFVGREPEMACLDSIAEGLKAGRGQIIALSGEGGIGKSRLIREWRKRLEDAGQVNWVEGRCLPTTASLAHGPFLDLIRRYAGIEEEQTEEAVRRRLDQATGRFFPGDPGATAIFADLLALEVSGEERALIESLPAKALRDRFFGLMQAVFHTLASDCPTVLVIEDMHWADSASQELVGHLLSLTERLPLVIVGTFRPDGGAPSLIAEARNRHPERFTDLPLRPLSGKSALEMVSRLLSADELSPVLRDLVLGRAEGNPFYVEELIRTLIDQGALTRIGGGGWQADETIGKITVPDSLHGLLMARLDRLPPETKWTAQQAAVIGRIFLARTLRRMSEGDRDLEGDLRRMEREDLIRERSRDPEQEYMFRHALTQEVAYESLLASRRKELHCRVGAAMEQIFRDPIGELTGIIGEHYLKGEDWAKASEYLLLSGDGALRLHANAEARTHYVNALEALANLPDTLECRRLRVDGAIKYARASYLGIPPKAVLDRLLEAKGIAESLPGIDDVYGADRMRLAHVRLQMGQCYFSSNMLREALGYYRPVLEVARESGDPELVGIPSLDMGSALLFQGHIGKARKLLDQAIPALARTDKWLEWTRAVHTRSFPMVLMGDYAAGQEEARRALNKGLELKAPLLISVANLYLSASYAHGDHGDARSLPASGEGLKVALQVGDPFLLYVAHGIRAWNLAMMGEFEEAEEQMAGCEKMAMKMGGQLILIDNFAARKAVISLNLGRAGEALALAERAVGIAQKMGGIWAEGRARRAWGMALAALTPPQWDGAEAQFSRSLELFETGQNVMETAYLHVTWGRICRDRGVPEAARAHWDKAADIYRAKDLPRWREKVRALKAGLGPENTAEFE